MSRVSRSIRRSAGAVASTSTVAGVRPTTVALTVATAFAMQAMPAWAQPSGAQVIHGQAGFSSHGNQLTITTQNGAGTRHSAIDWQSFSVPAGSITRFNQPSATSTSINRVIGANPSAIFGTLNSNGRLVLVNPAGIAVGKGAVVDTAAFTASTLAMSQADAMAGRLLFSGGASALQVDGRIVARSGDVVLIAPQLQAGAEAVIQSQGATVLAAGQRVEITGRGLEGIRMEVQAPGNEAVNLGKLQGDAVGIFAGTLRHSGLVQAHAVSVEGGKVVLKAQGDNVVSGAITARAGDKGGSIDVLGQRVALQAGAAIDASAPQGSGQVRVGGDYQGRNGEVPNAQFTSVAAGATINADATAQGTGGRVIVWADDTTLFAGQVSARGGAQGGDGGFAEVSGKRHLDFTGRADLRAPQGRVGTLLLDPEDVVIGEVGNLSATMTDAVLNAQLAFSDVQVTTSGGSSSAPLGGHIHLLEGANVAWDSGANLSLLADNGIRIDGRLSSVNSVGAATGGLHLRTSSGTISQGANSSIVMASLLAQADNGSVVLDQANNNIDTIAGYAYGAGNIFNYRNNNTLAIGSLGIGGYGYATGIDNYNGAGALADIRVVVDAGNLALNNASQLRGGSITLKAPVNVQVEGTYLEATSGLLHLDAGNDVVAGLSGYVQFSGRGGAGKGVKIDAGNDVRAGDYQLTVSTDQSPITVTAGGSIAGLATFQTQGGLAGTVQLTATSGTLSFNQVRSNGSYSGYAAGNVTLHAGGDINGGSVLARGSHSSGSAGSNVSVSSAGGSIWLGTTDVSGGYGSGSAAAGGAGGALTIRALGTTAAAGNVYLTAGTSASGGGSDYGPGGAAGSVRIEADKQVSTNGLQATGGSAYYGGSGNGGAGGTISVSSAGGNLSIQSADARGGDVGSGVGGQGGVVRLQALGADRSIYLQGTIEAGGGSAQDGSGGRAGNVLVEADNQVSLQNIRAAGGQAGGAGPVSGGQGGTVRVKSANGAIQFGTLDAWGNVTAYSGVDAQGGFGYSLAAGGAGGAITLTAVGTGPIAGDVQATYELKADGGAAQEGAAGNGGSVVVAASRNVQLYTASAGGGMATGAGGTGGLVDIASTGGNIGLMVAHAAGSTGGTVRLVTTEGNLQVVGADAKGHAGTGGLVLLQAGSSTATGGNVTANDINVSGADGNVGTSAGIVTVSAQRNIDIGSIAARGGMGWQGAGGNGGTVNVASAAGQLTIYEVNAAAGNGTSAGAGGTGGSITLLALGAAPDQTSVQVSNLLQVGGGSADAEGRAGDGGAITVRGSGGVLLTSLYASGGMHPLNGGGAGGAITVQSTSGNIDLSAQADGSLGGAVTVTADSGNIQAAVLDASGRWTSSLAAGGQGGAITLQAPGAGGTITVTSSLNVAGGQGGSAGGGDGGVATLRANGAITVNDVQVSGGWSWFGAEGGSGGAGGIFDARSVAGAISLNAIHASGGDAWYNGGSGGAGGTVILRSDAAGGSIQLAGQVLARGGSAPAGGGGTGGNVHISAHGAVRVFDIDVGGGSGSSLGGGNGGSVDVAASNGRVEVGRRDGDGTWYGSIRANGGASSIAAGGAGGAVTLSAYGTGDAASSGVLVTGELSAHGGGTSTGAGDGVGGNGGVINVTAARVIDIGSAEAGGGVDWYGTTGLGGDITLTSSGGDVHFSSLSANGRVGGNVTVTTDSGRIHGSWVDASGRWRDSTPGGSRSGGTITLQALGLGDLAGDVQMAGGSLTANGGDASNTLAGNAGAIHVLAQRDVHVGSIAARGGSSGSAGGGLGGDVQVRAQGGNIVLQNADATGGGGGSLGAGGAGGAILLVAGGAAPGTGGVTVAGGLYATGGNAFDGAGTIGGAVTVQAQGGVSLNQVHVSGGADWYTAGGAGGTVSVTSSSGDIQVTNIEAGGRSGGSVDVTALLGDIQVGGIGASGRSGSYAGQAGGNGGWIWLEARGNAERGGSIVAQNLLRVRGGSSSGLSAGSGGSVTVSAHRTIQVQDIDAVAGTAGSLGSANGGLGGTILLQSLAGDIGANALRADGAPGGQIHLTASGGSITLATASASGAQGDALHARGDGGVITLTARGAGAEAGNVNVTGLLEASGGGAYETAAGFGGAVIVAADQQISLNSIDVRGGASSAGVSAAGGGMGGFVNLQSETGNIAMPGSIVAGGGQGTPGGMGGFVQVSALQGAVSINDVSVAGGSGNTPAAAGGHAGGVDIRVRDDIRLGGPFAGYFVVLADGGNAGSGGGGGNGGFISLKSGAGSIQMLDFFGAFGISAVGGQGASGGSGGAVTLEAANNIKVPYVETWGASAYGSDGGGAGGNGGAISLKFGGTLDTYGLYAYGGRGPDGQPAVPSGGAGGAGGAVRIERAMGDLALPLIDVVASAGSGGHAWAESEGTGGAGGAGGSITLVAAAGSLSLEDARLYSAAGVGGLNVDGVTMAAGGAMGNVNVRATGDVNISNVNLDLVASNFTAEAGGTIELASTIRTGGGAVTLNAGVPALSATPGDLNLRAAIDTRGGEGAPSGAINLAATGTVLLAVPDTPPENPETAFSAFSITPAPVFSGGLTTITGASVVIDAVTNLVTSGELRISADSLALDGTVNSGGARTMIRTFTNSTPIRLGGADEAGKLHLSQNELDRVTASTLVIGSGDGTGGVLIEGPIALNPASVPALSLIQAGGIGQSAGAPLTVGALNADGGTVTLDNVYIGTLSGRGRTGAFTVVNHSPGTLKLGTVDGVAGIAGAGTVEVRHEGLLQLSELVTSTAGGDAVVLSADNLVVDGAGAITTPGGRWLTYLDGALAGNTFGPLSSGNFALWNRTYAGNPPGSVTETGNRLLFAHAPTVTIGANAATKVYDGSSTFTGLTFATTGLVDAAQHGTAFLQDVFTGALSTDATKNVGSYRVMQGTLGVAGYATVFNDNAASITPAALSVDGLGAVARVYDGTTAATLGGAVTFGGVVAGDDVVFGSGTGTFTDKNAGLGKTVTVGFVGLAGADLGNYTVTLPATVLGDITQRTLNASAAGVNKVYDRTTAASVVFGDDRVAGDVLTVGGSASFGDKNVGVGKLVTAGGLSVSGLDALNYALGSPSVATSADITPRTLVAGAIGQNKVYDGNTSAVVTFSDDRLAGDVFSVTGSAGFSNKNAGTGKLVTANITMLTGPDAANYALASPTAATTADIAARLLNVSAIGQNKVYDQTTGATVTYTDDRVAGDGFAIAGTASFGDKNAGAGKTITVSGLNLSGGDAGNYWLAGTTLTTVADITQRMLGITVAGLNKVYDRTTGAAVTFGDNRLGGDLLTVGGLASFADKNVGSAKLVSVNGIGLAGPDAGNYAPATTTASTLADITPRMLGVTALGQSKVYDGNTSALVTFSDNRVAGDVFTVSGVASFSDRNAGTGKLVTASALGLTGADAGNYLLSAPSVGTIADITQRTLNASAIGQNKVYDRTTTATVSFGDDRLAGDVLTVGGSAAFADKNAGAGKAVTVNGLALFGTDAGNYVLAGPTLVTAADITPRTLSVSALGQAKVYDGGTGATVTFSDDRLAGDILVIGGTTTFADKNVGTAKPVTASGLGVTGTDAGNYVLAAPTALAAADITARRLNVTAAGVNKVYDGTTAAAVTYGDDRVGGDLLTIGGSASFADKHVGIAKTVTVNGVALAGADASNYVLSGAPLATAADITRRVLSVGATAHNKVYDGTTAAAVTLSDDRIAGDVLAISGSGTFSDKHAGNGKTVTISGMAITSGADASNYVVASGPVTSSANIDPKTLNLIANNRPYDGTRNAPFTDDRLAGDQLRVTGTAQFADKHAGPDKSVTLTGMLIDLASGPDARNYVLVGATAGTTVPVDLSSSATIDRRLLQVGARDRVYDGTRDAQFKDDRIAGDELVLEGTAQFADKNAGIGKAVTISGLAIAAGADRGNYVLATPSNVVANITRRVLAVAARNKAYDGTVDASFSDDRIAGDVLTLSGMGRFEDKNAGTAKAVAVADLAIASGADAGNYVLPASIPPQRADITPAELTIGARNLTKNQGVSLTFLGSEFETTGLVGDEKVASVSLASTGAAAEAATGAYAIKPSNAVPGAGFLAGNYRIVYLDGALAVSAAASEPVKQVTTQVVTFATLFVEEAKAQAAEEKAEQKKKDPEKGKDDISVTDTQCTP